MFLKTVDRIGSKLVTLICPDAFAYITMRESLSCKRPRDPVNIGKVHRLSGCATYVKMNPLVLNSKEIYARLDAVSRVHSCNPLAKPEYSRERDWGFGLGTPVHKIVYFIARPFEIK
jgi:hypothetical protein